VAVGTTVVRALEGCTAANGELISGGGETGLVIGPGFVPRVVDALLSGMHSPGETHWQILRAFADDELLARAAELAERLELRCHELGDSLLILSGGIPQGSRAVHGGRQHTASVTFSPPISF